MSFLLISFIFVIIVSINAVKIVKPLEVLIVERLAKYNRTLLPGVNIIIPTIDKVRAKVNLSQQTLKIPEQGVITKDNKTITIGITVFYKIVDPVKTIYESKTIYKTTALRQAIIFTIIDAIRDIIGGIDKNNVKDSKEIINKKIYDILIKAADKWGCKINCIEITSINGEQINHSTLSTEPDIQNLILLKKQK